MQVSCSEDLLSETIAIHWRTKDESQKSISSSWIIYFYKSHSDAVLYWLLQFLSSLYKELLEDCSINDSSHSKKMIFEWDQACQTIFDHMKKRMTEVFILRHFDQNRKTILETDSFNYVNNDILSQYDDEKTLHSMIYYSKNLSLVECNYEIYDKKLLAIIRVFKHWWSELKLTELLIKMFTDHQALTSLMKDKELSRR